MIYCKVLCFFSILLLCSQSGYWVGKMSLRCWKRLAQAQAEVTEEKEGMNGTPSSEGEFMSCKTREFKGKL